MQILDKKYNFFFYNWHYAITANGKLIYNIQNSKSFQQIKTNLLINDYYY